MESGLPFSVNASGVACGTETWLLEGQQMAFVSDSSCCSAEHTREISAPATRAGRSLGRNDGITVVACGWRSRSPAASIVPPSPALHRTLLLGSPPGMRDPFAN